MIYSLGERSVTIKGKDWFIADNAVVLGSVTIENNVSIWYNVVIRGDIGHIYIGEDTNIQDGSILHTNMDGEINIGKGVSVGHMAMLHNCDVGDNTLIGINAVVLSGAKIGKNCIIAANSLIPGGKEIPDNSLVIGSPGKVARNVEESDINMVSSTASRYIENFKRYKSGLKPW